MRRPRALALIVAGSDPSGGAGLELGLKVHALFGVHAAAIATCVTLQTALGVRGVAASAVAPALRQIAALRAAAPIAVVQVGMVVDRGWIEALGKLGREWGDVPFVVDPVVAPTRGRRTLPRGELDRYRREVVARATLLTPNALEAAELLGWSVAKVRREPAAAAAALLALGPAAVLLKGGHLAARGALVDYLCGRFGAREFGQPRQAGAAPRGTGCALAAAIAAGLARGQGVVAAIGAAQRWLARARAAARPIGAGRAYLSLAPNE
ncbi:MAG: bifunctional hydroxymethylpyrimidine kinase/phosphomethylpyrimidine kinase [Planctomycetes bacterium]|nr:bifunctional hydroxymethylpyrimidine kinase/phosphomethylpyrimidine kinase [Planctomycetota bacterium]